MMHPDVRNALYQKSIMEMIYGDKIVGVEEEGEALSAPRSVFRVEMPNGKGPFNPGESFRRKHGFYGTEWYDYLHDQGADKPADKSGSRMGLTGAAFYVANGAAHYGFDNPQGVKHWFNLKAREFLAKYGGKIVEYQVQPGERVLETGEHEVIFNKDRARRTGEFDLIEGYPVARERMAA